MSLHVLVIFILSLCIYETAYAIKCWDCNSQNDPKCADPFDNSTVYMRDCAQEPELEHIPHTKATMCRKIRQKVNGEWRYYRQCAYLGEPGIGGDERYCLMRTGTHNIFMEICTCRGKDGCNTSSRLSSILSNRYFFGMGLVFILYYTVPMGILH